MADKDDKLIKKLNAYWEEGKKMRDIASKDWDNNPEMLKGDQLAKNRPAHKPPAVLNKLRSVSERKIALMTDTKPKFAVTPGKTGTGYPKVSEILRETMDAWWDDNSIDQKFARGLYYPINFGIMITKLPWSKKENDIVLRMVDPRHFVFDPHITDPTELDKAEYVVEEEFPPLAEVKMFNPEKTKELKEFTKPRSLLSQARDRFMRGLGGGGAFAKEREQLTAVPRAWIRHFWLADYSTEKKQVKVFIDKKEVTEEVLVRKYPGGRYIILAGNDIILHDEANPYWDGKHPYDVMDWYVDVDTVFGVSEMSALKNPQILYNKIMEVIIENAMLMNNGAWIADYNAFDVDGWKQLTNIPGQIIKKRPGTEVRRDTPSGIPANMLQTATYLENFIEKEPGISELQGKKPGQVQSSLGVESLQMMAAAMIRIKARALESLLQRVGQKFISRVIQFYTKDRVLYLVGPSGDFKEYNFVRKHFHEAISAAALKDAHRDFRFRVQPGSSLSMTKTQKALMAAELFKIGAVDDQAVLEAIEWPNWKEVLERTKMKIAAGLMPPPGGAKGKKGATDRKVK